jgi:hypothetical protein
MDMAHGTHEERLAAAHATLREGVAALTSSEDWQNLLKMAGSFHRYSPNNQMLLAVQGADGLVASFHTWKQITAEDGELCRIRKGETALRVFAPIRARNREVDPETGLPTVPEIVGYKLVPVFCQTQLVSPPDLPAQPKLLEGQDPSPELWEAVANQIYAAGFTLQRGQIDDVPEAKGITKFVERTVIVRDDLSPQQALKTQIHELAHVLMHDPSLGENGGKLRERVEVEAESVAFVVCDMLGVDSAEYSIPYVASWAAGDPDRVQETVQSVLAAARKIVVGIEAELGVDLRPNPIADAVAKHTPKPAPGRTGEPAAAPSVVAAADQASPVVRQAGRGTADDIIYRHLEQGGVDWKRLANELPGIDEHSAAARNAAGKPGAQAIVLAYAGASAEANVAVMRAHGLDDCDVRANLTVSFLDSLGSYGPLYHPDEVKEALEAPRPAKTAANEMVADLLVSAGRHPAAIRHLVETSGVPNNVVSLVEARLRRDGQPSVAGANRRSDRGLKLIDEWSGPEAEPAARPVPASTPPIAPPEPPTPAA